MSSSLAGCFYASATSLAIYIIPILLQRSYQKGDLSAPQLVRPLPHHPAKGPCPPAEAVRKGDR